MATHPHDHAHLPPTITRYYRVRDLQEIGCGGGNVAVGGDVLELSPKVAQELSGKLDQCDADGNIVETPESMNSILDELKAGRAHEHVSVINRELEKARGVVAELEQMLERAQEAEAAPVSPTPPPEQPVLEETVEDDNEELNP